MLRLGILMPRSTLFPSFGLDILNGLKLLFKQKNIFTDTVFISDNIGFGIDEQEIYTKAEKMLLTDDADVVILIAETRITEMLQPLFTACNKILLTVNMGATLPENWVPQPTSISHTLNFCMHAALTGKLAAEEPGRQVANVTSYYDGGYTQCFCMLNSNQQNGGIPVYNHVTHLRLDQFTLAPLINVLEENKELKTLLCLFAGEQAERFYQEIPAIQKKFDLDLFVSPMMFDESLKAALPPAFQIDKVKGFVPWHQCLDNEANRLFNELHSGATNKPANYFSLLGWETGLIIEQINAEKNAGNSNAHAIVKALFKTTFISPRGSFTIDEESHFSYGSTHLAACKNNWEVAIEKSIENTGDYWRGFKQQSLPEGQSSGWKNTYLCI